MYNTARPNRARRGSVEFRFNNLVVENSADSEEQCHTIILSSKQAQRKGMKLHLDFGSRSKDMEQCMQALEYSFDDCLEAVDQIEKNRVKAILEEEDAEAEEHLRGGDKPIIADWKKLSQEYDEGCLPFDF